MGQGVRRVHLAGSPVVVHRHKRGNLNPSLLPAMAVEYGFTVKPARIVRQLIGVLIMYNISGFHKFTEQDDYNEGCIGNGSDNFIDCHITTATMTDMKDKIAGFIGCKVSDLELDVCDEVGKMENAEGYEASESELVSWREGDTVLFYAVYSCYVMECNAVSARG